MGLLNLQTDLKSLKFGVPPASDRPQGGNSGEPYIKKSIDRNIVPQSEDFLLRGGINAPLDAATDIVRLTKFFADLKSPRGALFVAKQNLLSRTGVATQASDIIDWKNAPLNEGVYTPLSTIAQAGVGFSGGHIPKQGAIPFMGVRTYTDAKFQVIGEPSGKGNRLVDLYQTKIENFAVDPINILSYSGGPNSDLGIGKTNIKFASFDQRTGINSGKNFQTYQVGNPRQDLPFYDPLTNFPSNKITGVSTKYYNEVPFPAVQIGQQLPIFGEVGNGFISNANSLGRDFSISVYENGSLLSNSPRINDNGALTWDQFKIAEQTSLNNSKNSISTIKEDFRKPLIDNLVDPKFSTIISLSPSYKPKDGETIDGADGSRINMTSPGQKGNIISYTKGKRVNGRVSTVDKINAQPIYQSQAVRETNVSKNDLVKFRIASINKTNPQEKEFIHFRAYIDNFSDAYNASWNEEKYLGRGESFWKYGGFARSISLGFTVAAQSKPELIAQYKKLNFLASNLAPTYSATGYMGGPLVQLTLGGWCYELPGFISSMTLDVPQESPWEIGINDEGGYDPTVKEMPHIVKVTGFSFTPIHTFRPQKQTLTFNKKGDLSPNEGKSEYGPQRFIALKGGSPLKSNYDDTIN
tara:strand:- start:7539 stop:9452 length:1914 start_codon:yes stop_codon:yes gene_type:complete